MHKRLRRLIEQQHLQRLHVNHLDKLDRMLTVNDFELVTHKGLIKAMQRIYNDWNERINYGH